MKELFPTLVGNDRLKTQLGDRILRAALAHAYLIEGARGTGKHYTATLLSAALCCEKRDEPSCPLPCLACTACRKILSHGTPDLKLISRGENATLGVEPIRAMKNEVYLSPVDFGKKIYIIEEADKMTPAAQNALLLVLEEPPPNTFFFLLAEDGNPLLPTVRSRVQTLRLSRFPEDEVAAFLEKTADGQRLKSTDPARFKTVVTASDGALGLGLSLLSREAQSELLDERQAVDAILATLHRRTAFSQIYEAVMALSGAKRQDLRAELSRATLALRDLVVLRRAPDAPLSYFTDRAAAAEKSEQLSLRTLFRLLDAIAAADTELRKNANVHLTLSSLARNLYTSLK